MNYTVEIHDKGLPLRMDKAAELAIAAVTDQALTDCNFYCKEDTETLINTSLIHTAGTNGELRWVEDYAKLQYDLPATRTDKNPFACPKWCEVAEGNHGKKWERLFAENLRRNLR